MPTASQDDIRALAPYEGPEFHAALERVLTSPMLPAIVQAHFPKVVFPEFVALIRSLRDPDEFQEKIIAVAIKSLLKRMSAGLTCSGAERLRGDARHLFLSNHRDIICDTSLFSYAVWTHGVRTPAFCLGDNLLTNPFARDMIKLNKGITVKRNLAPRELLRWSHALSALIAERIAGGESVWLAQREGRAKDGNDRTNPGLLKMLALEGEGEPMERLARLAPIPVAISYELDPCDAMKARELALTARDGRYEKAPDEDQRSMILGIQGYKGRIHIAIGHVLTAAIADAAQGPNRKEQLARLAVAVDRQLHAEYRLFPTNYIAYDLLAASETMSERYSREEREAFVDRMEKQLASVAKEPSERLALRPFFLAQYANPVRNRLAPE